MEEERDSYFWRDVFELHHPRHNHVGYWRTIQCGGQQFSGYRDEQHGDAHRQCSGCRTNDHFTAHESNAYSGADGFLLGRCDGHRAAELSVAEERRNHFWRNVFELHHTRYDHVGYWRTVQRTRQQFSR